MTQHSHQYDSLEHLNNYWEPVVKKLVGHRVEKEVKILWDSQVRPSKILAPKTADKTVAEKKKVWIIDVAIHQLSKPEKFLK